MRYDIRAIADQYLAHVDLAPINHATPKVKVNPDHARRIADAYAAIPSGRPCCGDALRSYESLQSEIADQFRWLTLCGFTFVPFGKGEDPYQGSAEMIRDAHNGCIHVYADESDHPFFTNQDQFMFRAVHDVFGHAMHGHSFGPNGEENAWRCHMQMFSPLARSAMTAETRGQNSWVNFGPFAHLPAKDRPYAEQKANLLPRWCEILNS